MARLCFAGKCTFYNEERNVFLRRLVVHGRPFVDCRDRDPVTPELTFVLYYDRDAQRDHLYIRADNGQFLSPRQETSAGKFTTADLPGPGVSFQLQSHPDYPNDSGVKQFKDVASGKVARIEVLGLGSVSIDGLLFPNNQRSNAPFRLGWITRGFDEIMANGGSWANADLRGVDFTGMADLLPRVTNWGGADMRGAVFKNLDLRQVRFSTSANLPEAKLAGTNLEGKDLSQATLDQADLSGANVKNVKLTNASMISTNFSRANLTGATFGSAPKFSTNKDARTSFVGATLDGTSLHNWSYLDLREVKIVNHPAGTVTARHADLSGVTFSGTILRGATLDECDLTGAVLVRADLSGSRLVKARLQRASLSSARLVGADCTQAQLGATTQLFALPMAQRASLAEGDPTDDVRQVFATRGIELTRSANVTIREPGRSWLLADGENLYRISVNESDATLEVRAYLSTDQAAVLAGAYMPDAVFKDAELYGVNMSGAHWYGSKASALNANLEQIDGSNANFGQIDLAQAQLMGATLSSAILAGANLAGAKLGRSAAGRQSSLANANLAGTDLTQAELHNAVLTNAAIAVDATGGTVTLTGVPLFRLDSALAADLNQQTPTVKLKNDFSTNGYPLEADAKVQPLSTGTAWEITQGSGNPQQVGKLYASLRILHRGQHLQVYGSALWITRLGAGGSLETVRFTYDRTKVTEREMNSDTTCPNGKTLRTNQAAGTPWDEMMTTLDKPPTPPACIPSPDHWCPPAT